MKIINKRLFRFIVAILAGIVLSVIFGWYVYTPGQGESSLGTLRMDYKTDYVLMVSEVYSQSNDIKLAEQYLLLLGEETPIRYIQEAIIFAKELNYSQLDMENLARLAIDMQANITFEPGDDDA